ncbi:MAG TPA: DUF4186 family protein, partial [Thermoanaerobaculia bacterium]
MTKKLKANGMEGKCRACGASLVDWRRMHAKNLSDAEHTFATLRLETIRHHFWHIPLSLYAINYARRKGKVALRAAAIRQIQQRVGQATNYRDGFQTPRENSAHANAIDYAQHATACCCRICIDEWYGVPRGRELTRSEVEYFADLAMLYLDSRIPDLAPDSIR